MLKARFAKTAAATPAQENTTSSVQESPDQRRNTFIQSIFANAPQEWEIAKTIPARAFIYPTEYAWGSDEQGNQISRSLEDFPPNAKKLREKITQSLEDLAAQGINIETISLDQAIIDLFDKGIL
jgi:DsbC/DsbD-like thiol-disulfide interchange protein